MQKLWHHFNEHQRFLFRNVSIIVIGLFINQLLQTVGSIIIVRMVNDPVQFGEINLLLQIFGMIGLFLNVGFNSALVFTFSTNTQEAVQNKFRYALAGSTFFGIVISFIVAALSPLLAKVYQLPALQTALVLGSIMFIFNSIVNMGVSSFSGNRNFATQAVFMVIMTTFSTLGTIAGVIWPLFGDQADLWGISFWMGIGAILTALITSWRVHVVHRPSVFFSSVSRLGGNILAGIGRTKANFWVMIVAGIFVITLVPLIAANNPVLAVWIYTGGWAISALSMIWFFYLESFTLNWWEAYGEPLLPSALMGMILEVGQYIGSGFPLFIVIGIISLLMMTAWIEARTKTPNELTHKKSV